MQHTLGTTVGKLRGSVGQETTFPLAFVRPSFWPLPRSRFLFNSCPVSVGMDLAGAGSVRQGLLHEASSVSVPFPGSGRGAGDAVDEGDKPFPSLALGAVFSLAAKFPPSMIPIPMPIRPPKKPSVEGVSCRYRKPSPPDTGAAGGRSRAP